MFRTRIHYLVILVLYSATSSSGRNTISSDIVTDPVRTLPTGKIQLHRQDVSPCGTVLLMHVGTAMQVQDYREMARDIVSRSRWVQVIVMDSNPFFMTKQHGRKCAALVNVILTNITSIVPTCSSQNHTHYMIGGHSSGGQASIEAIQGGELLHEPLGFVGFAPYVVPSDLDLLLPTINFGFLKETCLVKPEKAALAAYQKSNPKHRVFFQIQNNHTENWQGPHCSFANSGCLGMCTGSREFSMWMHDYVGKAIAAFERAVRRHVVFHRDIFRVESGDHIVNLYVNRDQPPSLIE